MTTHTRVGLNELFKQAIKTFNKPIYKIAALADVCPTLIYRGINNVENFVPGDARIKRIADAINYTGPCFMMDKEAEKQASTAASK